MLYSPFQKLAKSLEKRLIIILVVLLIILVILMQNLNFSLKNEVSPSGIVSFELAKDLVKSEAILNSWDILSKTSAGMSLGFDFLFLIVYSLFISLLIHKLNVRLWKHSKIYNIGIIFIWFVIFAGFFDSIENIALINLLLGDLKQIWSSIAYYFAISKFSLLTFGILYIIINSIILIFRKKYSYKLL